MAEANVTPRSTSEQSGDLLSFHRDAELIRAWADWQAAMRAHYEAPDELSDDDDKRLNDNSDEIESRIAKLKARTSIGLAVKLRILFLDWAAADRDVSKALVYGEPITADMLDDGRSWQFWKAIRIAERLAH